MTSGIGAQGAIRPGRRIAAGLATAGLSVTGAFILVYGLPEDWPIALLSLVMAMALVAVATVIGTLRSGRGIGLLLGAPPLSIVSWIAVAREDDPLGGLFAFFITAIAVVVCVASWAVTSDGARKRRNGRSDPVPRG